MRSDDFLDGGEGDDTAVFDGYIGTVDITLGGAGDVPDDPGLDDSTGAILKVGLQAYDEQDVLRDIELIRFGSGDQHVSIGPGLSFGNGLPRIDGGEGRDTIDFSRSNEGIAAQPGLILNFETVVGSAFDDTLALAPPAGGASPPSETYLYGGAGDDVLAGCGAVNYLEAGTGLNEMIGGSGTDYFILGNGTVDQGSASDWQTITATHVIRGVDASDRLVIRLADLSEAGFAQGFAAAEWGRGFVLNGGVSEDWLDEEISSDFAQFDTSLWGAGSYHIGEDGARIDEWVRLTGPRSGFGDADGLCVTFIRDLEAHRLRVSVHTTAGNYDILVEDYEDGDLGISFLRTPHIHWSYEDGPQRSVALIEQEIAQYNSKMTQLYDTARFIDIPRPAWTLPDAVA